MIESGDFLIDPNAPRPRCFEIETNSHPYAWTLFKQILPPAQLEEELAAGGWTFFFMAGRIRTRAFGFDREKAIYAALQRGIRATRAQGCNCLQVEGVEMHSFLGIPYVSMLIRPRHIQKGVLFAGPSIGVAADITAHELRPNVAAII